MSGITKPGEGLSPLEPSNKAPKIKKATKSLTEEALTSSKSAKPKKVDFKKSSISSSEGVRFDLQKIKKRNKEIKKLYDRWSPNYKGGRHLKTTNFKLDFSNFDKDNHTLVERHHIFLITKKIPQLPLALAITAIYKKVSFARGSFGKLYTVDVVGAGKNELAFKLSRKLLKTKLKDNSVLTRGGKRANKDIQYEIGIMNFIRQNGKNLTGLNVAMYGVANFKNQVGYFVKRFHMNGVKFANLKNIPAETHLDVMRQVSKGMKTLHSLGIVHRDIKPDNILFKKNAEILPPSFVCVLSDFGNTIHLNKIFDAPYPKIKKIFGYGTHCFTSQKYYQQVEKELEQLNKLKPETLEYSKIVDTIKNILIRNDELAMALSLYTLWVGHDPDLNCFKKSDEYFALDKGFERKQIKKMSQELTATTFQIAESSFGDEDRIVNLIMNPILDGLE